MERGKEYIYQPLGLVNMIVRTIVVHRHLAPSVVPVSL
jgi:hypothetical protein